MSLPTATD